MPPFANSGTDRFGYCADDHDRQDDAAIGRLLGGNRHALGHRGEPLAADRQAIGSEREPAREEHPVRASLPYVAEIGGLAHELDTSPPFHGCGC